MANATRYGNGQAQWSDQLTNTLRELWATWTAGELCRLTGLTRNAIIGKAWRLGLPRKKPSGNGTTKPQRVGPRIRPPVLLRPDAAGARHRTGFPRADDRGGPIA